jgi:hypothetical protein
MDWATFWADFSQTHLVTLVPSLSYLNFGRKLGEDVGEVACTNENQQNPNC